MLQLLATPTVRAQQLKDTKVSISIANAPLSEAIGKLAQQSGLAFTYNEQQLSNHHVSVSAESESAESVLQRLLSGLPFTYTERAGKVAIYPSRPHYGKSATGTQEELEVRGAIKDTLGSPLQGVSVSMAGKPTVSTSSDENGMYILRIPAASATLTFTMVGYRQQTMEVGESGVYDIVMREELSDLDEVVVVAYGTQKKTELVGAVTTISPGELKVPSSNLTTALAGRLAGIIAYQRSGEPGMDNADFFIRGVTTFGYKVDPLILIDGVEFTATDLARLQPDDIASFSIMKDASATALYGARGANGVILVTTKEGKEGRAKVGFRLENSLSAPTRNVELADPVTYMQLHNEATRTRDPNARELYDQRKIDNTMAGTNPYLYPATDWRGALFKDYAMNQRANLNVSGGGKVARYYFAGTFNRDNGILQVDPQNNFNNNIDLKTYLLRSNVNVNVTKTTEMGVRMYGTFDEYTGPIDGGTQMYRNVMRSNPVLFPPYFPKTEQYEHVHHILFGGTEQGNYINPYADMVKGYRDYSRSVMMAQFELKQDLSFFTEGLSLRALGNTNRTSYFSVSRQYRPFFYQPRFFDQATGRLDLQLLNERQGAEYLDYSEGEKTISSVFYMESALNYNRIFNDKHNVGGMVVYIMRQRLNGNAGDLQQSLPFRNLGLSGRFTYAYDSRYFGEFNFGYNGSERFYRNHRFGFFPSGGVAWHISNEKFWEPLLPIVSLLKIRATYGLVGNDEIGGPQDRFFYLSNVNMDNSGRGATFGIDNGYSNSGVSISRYDNRDITWETAEKTNIGLELKLLDKIGIQADFFSEYRRNILMTRASIPAVMGLSADVRANVGEASGKGFDMSVDYQQNFGQHLWVTARGNFTYATSAYRVYEEPEYADEWWKSRIGYPLSQRWGYIAERLFVDDDEVANSPVQDFGAPVRGGDIKFRDINNDGQITALDQVPMGNPTTPEIVYGFGFSAGFKNIDLSCFFQGLAQESFWIDPLATAPFIRYVYSGESTRFQDVNLENQLLKAYADNHWSEANNNVMALWPRLNTVADPNNSQPSTWFMRDGSFLRLKTLEFGYTFQRDRVQRLGMESFRLYFSGTNLLTWSRFKLWDVEMAGNGLNYPVQRVLNIGLQVSL
ncbi:SusC/RagA family TonB-linked outer membrane protein [Parapedobacter composti]|nr:SusC/RagA family TonB-linked outer membrane protein [Parapedobacter composti]